MKVREKFIILSIVLIVVTVTIAQVWTPIWWSFIVIGPLILMGIIDMIQKKHAIRRNFPVLGRMRYLLEAIRPEIMQYFVETDTQGRPINRIFRTLVYQRSKKVNDTTPFGTQVDVYRAGYEWMDHSMYVQNTYDKHNSPRILIGGKDCKKPYNA
ncbi:MAG: FMN-binding glutamate synthase family protein, partial [Flavobacteriaceae bacterium]|nr:FMN-binding glutamate synthase family protein [Flavobacteriaceae bacterium]